MMQRQLAMVVPKHVTAERMVRVALTTLLRSPKLAQSTQESFFKCLLDCAQWGIEPDGRRAHLIPFDTNKKVGDKWVKVTECTLIIDYKGFAELAYRSGLVRKIHAMEVRHGDIFEYDCGEVLKHVPHFLRRDPGKPASAGDIFAYYCRVHMEGDVIKSEVMSVDEVNAIRDKSQGYQAFKAGKAKSSPWNDYPVEMGKKTVFKRASKWLPLTAEFRDVIDRDNDDYAPRVEASHTIDSLGALLAPDDELPAIEDSNIIDEQPHAPPEPQDSPEPAKPKRQPKDEPAKLTPFQDACNELRAAKGQTALDFTMKTAQGLKLSDDEQDELQRVYDECAFELSQSGQKQKGMNFKA
jgi:recombination protein RecT